MKQFPFDFKAEHEGFEGVVAYRFMFRTTRSKDVRVAYRVGAPADIQAFADCLAQDPTVLNAACEYQYSVELKHLAKITPIKSQDDDGIGEEDE